jgi:hypothetical protein
MYFVLMVVEDAWPRTFLEYTEVDRCTSSCELVARHTFSVIAMFMFLLQATLHLTTPIELKIIKGCRFLTIITSIYSQGEKRHAKVYSR